MKSNPAMATRGRPVTTIEERSAAAQAEMARRRSRVTFIAEYAIGALATLMVAAVMAYALVGFFTEPDPFYGKGPQAKVAAPR